jgi:hypothetical protein
MTREHPERVKERGISTWPQARCICTAGKKKSAKPKTRSCKAATLAQKPCGELAQSARTIGADGDMVNSPWTDWRYMAHQIPSTDVATVVPDLTYPRALAMYRRRPDSGLKSCRYAHLLARMLGQQCINRQPSITDPMNAHHLASPTDSSCTTYVWTNSDADGPQPP